MNAVIGDDAVDAAQAELEVSLAQLLGDHLGGGIWIQKAIAQHLADDLIGAAIIGLGAGFLGAKGKQATLLEVRQQLIVALATNAVFGGDTGDAVFQTLAFDEHEEALGQFIGEGNGQSADWSGELAGLGIELES